MKSRFIALFVLCSSGLMAQRTYDARLHFDSQSSVLKSSEKKKIDQMIKDLQYPVGGSKVEIIGHTDSTYTYEFNMKLSQRRAKAVEAYLRRKGVKAKMVSRMEGKGFTMPIANSQTDENKKMNRRVELMVHNSLLGYEVPSEKHTIRADRDSKITTKTGAKIMIPKGSMLDASGNVVSGNVTIVYRELRDMAAYMAAGLPMQTDNNKGYMHSNGLFEVYAYKNGERLEMHPNKEMKVQFVQTDQMSGLSYYAFDAKKDSWKPVAVVPAYSMQEDDFLGSSNANACSAKADQSMMDAAKMGYALSNLEFHKTLDQRFEDMHFMGTTYTHGDEKNDAKYQTVQLDMLKFKGKKGIGIFRIKDTKGNNPELAGLAKHKFFIMDKSGNLKSKIGAKYTDVRLIAKGDSYSVRLKDANGFTEIPLYFKKPGKLKKAQKRFDVYMADLAERRKSFDEPILAKRAQYTKIVTDLGGNVDGTSYTYDQYCFFKGARYFMDNADEMALYNAEDWNNYFFENNPAMRARFDAAYASVNNNSMNAKSQMTAYNSTMMSNWDAIKAESQKKYDAKELRMVNVAANKFGAYGMEKIVAMDTPVAISPKFKDAKGRSLKAYKVIIAQKGVNGIMMFDPSEKIMVSKTAPGQMLMVDRKGDLYHFDEKGMAQAVKGGANPVVKMNKVDVKESAALPATLKSVMGM